MYEHEDHLQAIYSDGHSPALSFLQDRFEGFFCRCFSNMQKGVQQSTLLEGAVGYVLNVSKSWPHYVNFLAVLQLKFCVNTFWRQGHRFQVYNASQLLQMGVCYLQVVPCTLLDISPVPNMSPKFTRAS